MDLLKTAPNRGDIVWLDLNPKKGREQKGHRPVLVLSHQAHNEAYGLAIVVSITRQVKGFGIEVLLPEDCNIKGVILSNQIQAIDWIARDIVYATSLQENTIDEVLKRLAILVN